MSRHASSLALMRKSGPYQSASSMLAHLYTNLRHLLGNRERGPVDSLETWGMMLSGIPSPDAFINISMLQMAQTIDRMGLTLKNVEVTPKVWRAEHLPRESRTDPKIAVPNKGLLTTNYSEGETTTGESNGTQRLYVPGTANGADMYMIFHTYGTVGNSPLHKLYREIATYILDLYLLTHEEMEEMSMPGGVEVLLRTARAGFSSIKDQQEVARIDAISAELLFRQGDCFKALKHAMSITGDSYNLERQVALKAVEKLSFSVEGLMDMGDFEGANELMARLLREFPYVTQFHELQVRMIELLCKHGQFEMAHDIVPRLMKLKHVRLFDGLVGKIDELHAEAEQERLAEEQKAKEQKEAAEQEALDEAEKMAVPGFLDIRKEIGELVHKGDLSEAILRAQNAMPRFDHPKCLAELEYFIQEAGQAQHDSEVQTATLSMDQLSQRIEKGLSESTFGEKMANKIMASQGLTAGPANDTKAEEAKKEELKEPAGELIERAVMPDGRETAAPIVQQPSAEVAEAIASDEEQAEAEEATG